MTTSVRQRPVTTPDNFPGGGNLTGNSHRGSVKPNFRRDLSHMLGLPMPTMVLLVAASSADIPVHTARDATMHRAGTWPSTTAAGAWSKKKRVWLTLTRI